MSKFDIESGRSRALYPAMQDSPEHRWAFIRKVYAIVTVQLLITNAVSFPVIHFPEIANFLLHTWPGIAVYVSSFVLSLILIFVLFCVRHYHPWNFVVLALFTISIAFTVGLSCSFSKGKIIFEAVILTGVAVIGLTLYTFWGVKRGHDYSFLGPILSCSLLILIVFGLIQVFFPLGKLTMMIYSVIGALVFCGYLVYDTNELIKKYSYDDYIWAAMALYLDIVNLFLYILSILNGGSGGDA